MQEAFKLFRDTKNDGGNIEVILSSRSFEYYMLLHSERIYRAFEKTECGEKVRKHTRYFHCCLPDAVKDKECAGTVCINGYARSKGYWEKSKDEQTFLTATNIWRGMANGEYVRQKAIHGKDDEIYMLNPYTDFHFLMARLQEARIFTVGQEIKKDMGRGEFSVLMRHESGIEVRNGSSVLPIKLEKPWFEIYEFPSATVPFTKFKKDFTNDMEASEAFAVVQGERKILSSESSVKLEPGQSRLFHIDDNKEENRFAVLTFFGDIYLLF